MHLIPCCSWPKWGRWGQPACNMAENFWKFLWTSFGCRVSKHKCVLFPNQTWYARGEMKIMQGKINYPMCNGMMDTYHVPHGEGPSFESRAGLSIPLVRLSSPGGGHDDDTSFRHTFLVVGATSTSFFSDSKNFLRWILRLTLLWLWSLICFVSSWMHRLSMNSMRASMDGMDGFFGSFSNFFFWLTALTCEHCSTFGLKVNFSFCPLMLSWISPLPHQYVHLSHSRMAFPRWEASWCQLPCRERQSWWG